MSSLDLCAQPLPNYEGRRSQSSGRSLWCCWQRQDRQCTGSATLHSPACCLVADIAASWREGAACVLICSPQASKERVLFTHLASALRRRRGCQYNLHILSALSAVAARPAQEVVRLSPVSKTGAASMSSASSMAATRSSAAINPACSQSSIASNLRTNRCCRGSGASAIA